MKQSSASRSSSPSWIWGTGKPTGAFAMITANTDSLYGHLLDNIRKWRERFGRQFPQFVRKHKLTVLRTRLPDFRRVFVYFWHHVDRLGKLPLEEQQLTCSHVRFTSTIRPLGNTADPYDTMTIISYQQITDRDPDCPKGKHPECHHDRFQE